MVELLHRPVPAGFLKATGQPADVIGGLVDSDHMTGTLQIPGSCHAAETCSDDCDFRHMKSCYSLLVNRFRELGNGESLTCFAWFSMRFFAFWGLVLPGCL